MKKIYVGLPRTEKENNEDIFRTLSLSQKQVTVWKLTLYVCHRYIAYSES